MSTHNIDLILLMCSIFFGIIGAILHKYMTKAERKSGIGYSESELNESK